MKPIIWAVSILAAGWSFPKLLAEDGERRRNFLKLGPATWPFYTA